MSDILQVLTLPIVDQNVCKTIFSGMNTVTENMICAGSLTGKDTCKVCVSMFFYTISFLSFELKCQMCFHFSLIFDVNLTLMKMIDY